VQCVHETGSGSKNQVQRFFEFEKNVIEPELKGSNFWKNLTQTRYQEKFLNVKIESIKTQNWVFVSSPLLS
jgi:hypothetical protein